MSGREDGGVIRVLPKSERRHGQDRDIGGLASDHPSVELEPMRDNALLNPPGCETDLAWCESHRPPETFWGRRIIDQHAGLRVRGE